MEVGDSSSKIRVLIQGNKFFDRGVLRAAMGAYLSLPRMGGGQEDSPEEGIHEPNHEGLVGGGGRALQAEQTSCVP